MLTNIVCNLNLRFIKSTKNVGSFVGHVWKLLIKSIINNLFVYHLSNMFLSTISGLLASLHISIEKCAKICNLNILEVKKFIIYEIQCPVPIYIKSLQKTNYYLIWSYQNCNQGNLVKFCRITGILFSPVNIRK